jgi:hypothetical protein
VVCEDDVSSTFDETKGRCGADVSRGARHQNGGHDSSVDSLSSVRR